MNGTLNLSEAFTLGLHAVCYLAGREGGKASTREIARYLGVSEAHLAKVMQRLTRTGILKSTRGPGGGFSLSRDSKEITLMDIYESLEGRYSPTSCLLGRETCLGRGCVLAGLLKSADSSFENYLRNTDLESAGGIFGAQRKKVSSADSSFPGDPHPGGRGAAAESEKPGRKGPQGRKRKGIDTDAGPSERGRK